MIVVGAETVEAAAAMQEPVVELARLRFVVAEHIVQLSTKSAIGETNRREGRTH